MSYSHEYLTLFYVSIHQSCHYNINKQVAVQEIIDISRSFQILSNVTTLSPEKMSFHELLRILKKLFHLNPYSFIAKEIRIMNYRTRK